MWEKRSIGQGGAEALICDIQISGSGSQDVESDFPRDGELST